MMIKNMYKSFLVVLICSFIALSLTSCGSGGGAGSSSGLVTGPGRDSGSGTDPGLPGIAPANTGSVAILLTDAPTDDFLEVNVTINKIELLSDDSKVTVFSGNKIINLLDLKNETTLFSIENNIPTGWYNKIRLTVSDVQLIDEKGDTVTKPVKLGGNGKIDLNPREHFSVSPGEMLTLQLDLDAEKSLKLHQNTKWYNFRPVIFIDIIKVVPPEKLLRVKGIVYDIDLIDKKFRLCPDKNDVDSYMGASNDDNNNSCCITVLVSDDTSFFSSEEAGHPVPFKDLEEGSSSAVIGRYQADSLVDDDSKSCKMGLDAIVVQSGDFLKLTGTIYTGADSINQFEFQVDRDQAVAPEDLKAVQLQEGTKIYSTMGVALDESAIKGIRRAEIDGKLVSDVLNATFISVDLDSISLGKLTGNIDNINDIARTFDLITTDETVCVEVTDNVQIFLITEDGSLVSQMITFEELDNGKQVDIYGSNNGASGCFVSDTIIAFETEISFTTDISEWMTMVSNVELFTTTSDNIVLADEVDLPPALNANLGSVLTFQAAETGLSRGFTVEALQPGAGFTFSDSESGTPLIDFEDALSVGDSGNFEDDDWWLSLLDSASMTAFGVEIRNSRFGPDEVINLYSGNQVIGTVDLSSLPATGNDNYFIGITSDVSFDSIGFDEDPDGDDIAIADFRFGTMVP